MPVFLMKRDNTTHDSPTFLVSLHFVLKIFHQSDTEIDLVLFRSCIVLHSVGVMLFVGQAPD